MQEWRESENFRQNCSLSEVNVFLCLTQKFKIAAKMAGNNFFEKSPAYSADKRQIKKFVEFDLSHTVSECVFAFNA